MELIYNNTYYIVGKNQLFEDTEETSNYDNNVELLKAKLQAAANSSTDTKEKEIAKKFIKTLNDAIGSNGSDNTERNNNFKETIEKGVDICNNIENMKDVININGQDYKKVED